MGLVGWFYCQLRFIASLYMECGKAQAVPPKAPPPAILCCCGAETRLTVLCCVLDVLYVHVATFTSWRACRLCMLLKGPCFQ